jgi:GNAT superfamily N-acetyltransferase
MAPPSPSDNQKLSGFRCLANMPPACALGCQMGSNPKTANEEQTMSAAIVSRTRAGWSSTVEVSATIDGHEAGSLMVDINGYIHSFNVPLQYRGTGIIILKAAIKYIVEELHETPSLNATRHNKHAKPFYEKMGFVFDTVCHRDDDPFGVYHCEVQ